MISSTTPHFTPTHKSFTHNEERKMSVGVTNIEQNGYTRYMHVEQSDTQMIDGTSNIILISKIKTNKKKNNRKTMFLQTKQKINKSPYHSDCAFNTHVCSLADIINIGDMWYLYILLFRLPIQPFWLCRSVATGNGTFQVLAGVQTLVYYIQRASASNIISASRVLCFVFFSHDYIFLFLNYFAHSEHLLWMVVLELYCTFLIVANGSHKDELFLLRKQKVNSFLLQFPYFFNHPPVIPGTDMDYGQSSHIRWFDYEYYHHRHRVMRNLLLSYGFFYVQHQT